MMIPPRQCPRQEYLRHRLTSEHLDHTDYSRFWCDACNGWNRIRPVKRTGCTLTRISGTTAPHSHRDG